MQGIIQESSSHLSASGRRPSSLTPPLAVPSRSSYTSVEEPLKLKSRNSSHPTKISLQKMPIVLVSDKNVSVNLVGPNSISDEISPSNVENQDNNQDIVRLDEKKRLISTAVQKVQPQIIANKKDRNSEKALVDPPTAITSLSQTPIFTPCKASNLPSTNQSISASIDSFTHQPDQPQKPAFKKSWFQGILPCLPALEILLDKRSKEAKGSMQALGERLQEEIGRVKVDREHTHLFGLYNPLISALTSSKRSLLYFLSIIETLVEIAMPVTYHLLLSLYLNHPPISSSESKTFLASFSIYLMVSILVPSILLALIKGWRIKLEQQVLVTNRLAVKILLYDKLSISDVYFLQKSDYNLIYRLFYSELHDFTKYGRVSTHSLQLMIVNFFIVLNAVLRLFLGPDSIWAPLHPLSLFWILQQFFLYLFLNHRRRPILEHKRLMFKERKDFFEILCNFKSIRVKNLGKACLLRLKKIYHKMSVLETKIIKDNIGIYYCYKYLDFVAIGTYFVTAFISRLFCGEEESSCYGFYRWIVSIGFNYKDLLVIFYGAFVVKDITESYAFHFQAYYDYKEADKLMEKFFNNNLVIDDPIEEDPTGPKGEISFVDCEVYQQDKASIDKIIDYIMVREEPEYAQLNKQTEDTFHESTSSGKTGSRKNKRTPKKPRSRRENWFRIKKPAFDSAEHPRLKILFSNLNLMIKSGTKLCVYDGGRIDRVRGFMDLLIGECCLAEGQARMNGKIGLYDAKAMCFIIGGTIQDNIIFGNDFNQTKYDKVLDGLHLHFDGYPGMDKYQITEQASNIQFEDRFKILVARLLYNDSDIYIIKDLLSESESLINLPLIKNIFERFFTLSISGKKTVIFNSNVYPFIELSTEILKFDRNGEMTLTKTKEFSNFLSKRPFIQARNSSAIHKNNFRLSSYHSTHGFQEELLNQKKRLDHKKAIEKFKNQNSNFMDQLAYGIMRVAKKIDEGKNIEEPKKFHLRINSVKTIFRLPETNNKLIHIIYFLVVMSKFIFLFLFEYTLFKPLIQNEEEAHLKVQVSEIADLKLFTIFFAGFLLFTAIKNVLCNRFNVHTKKRKKGIDKMTKKLLNCHLTYIDKNYFHSILDRILQGRPKPESIVLGDKILLEEKFGFLIGIAFLLMKVYGWIVPGLITFSIIMMGKLLTRRLGGAMMKVVFLREQYRVRIDTLNYQLLNLIGNYRISNLMKKLDQKFQTLSDNDTFLHKILHQDFYLASFFGFYTISMLAPVAFILMYYVCHTYPPLKMISLGAGVTIFGPTILVRALNQWRTYRMSLLQLYHSSLAGKRGREFEERLDMHQRIIEHNHWQRIEFDKVEPILFKNVSLSFGFQSHLKRVSFKVYLGARVGLVGLRGAGKTSIFNLLTGIINRDSHNNSTIKIFGLNIEDLEQEHFESIFMIEKEPRLLHGTVRSNLNPCDEFEDDELIEIIQEFKTQGLCQKVMEALVEKPTESVHLENEALSVLDYKPDLPSTNRFLAPSELFKERNSNQPEEFEEVNFSEREKPEKQQPAGLFKNPIKKNSTNPKYQRSITTKSPRRNYQDKKKSYMNPNFTGQNKIMRLKSILKYSGDEKNSKLKNKLEIEDYSNSNCSPERSKKSNNFSRKKSIDSGSIKLNGYVPSKLSKIQTIGIHSKNSKEGSYLNPSNPVLLRHHSNQLSPRKKLNDELNNLFITDSNNLEKEQVNTILAIPDLNELKKGLSLVENKREEDILTKKNSDLNSAKGFRRASKTLTNKAKNDLNLNNYGENNYSSHLDQVGTFKINYDIPKYDTGMSPENDPEFDESEISNILSHLHFERLQAAEFEKNQENDFQPSKNERGEIENSKYSQIFSPNELKLSESRVSPGGSVACSNAYQNPQLSRKSFLLKPSSVNSQESGDTVNLVKFLDMPVSFNGLNLPLELRKFCLLARAIKEKPLLLLIYEDVLEFGQGIETNFHILDKYLPDTTIMCITKGNEHLRVYDKIFLMDSGCILEKGSPSKLLFEKQSLLKIFIKETDPKVYKKKYFPRGLSPQHTMTRSINNNNMRTSKKTTFSQFLNAERINEINHELPQDDDPKLSSKSSLNEDKHKNLLKVKTAEKSHFWGISKAKSIENHGSKLHQEKHSENHIHGLYSSLSHSNLNPSNVLGQNLGQNLPSSYARDLTHLGPDISAFPAFGNFSLFQDIFKTSQSPRRRRTVAKPDQRKDVPQIILYKMSNSDDSPKKSKNKNSRDSIRGSMVQKDLRTRSASAEGENTLEEQRIRNNRVGSSNFLNTNQLSIYKGHLIEKKNTGNPDCSIFFQTDHS